MLEIKNINKKYNNIMVLNNLSLILQDKASLAIKGENGSGKTTLLKIIGGLVKEDSGELLYNGKALPVEPNLRNVAISFQIPILWNHLSVKENILFAVNSKEKKDAHSLVDYLANGLGIENLLEKKPTELSGGQAKRVDLARALAKKSEILLLDEPLSYLDDKTKEKTLHFIKEYSLNKCSTIVATHDNEVAQILCTQMKQLVNGKLL